MHPAPCFYSHEPLFDLREEAVRPASELLL